MHPRIEFEKGEAAGRHAFLPLIECAQGIQLLVGFHLYGTSDRIDLPEQVLNRLLCHALVQHLPDSALPDALSSLSSDYEMHMARLAPPRPLPAPEKKTLWARAGERRVASLPPVIEID